MGDQFNWQFDESVEERPSPDDARRSVRDFWITATLITILIVGGWVLLRRQQESASQTLIESTQASLDLMQIAITEGDGELFFALQDSGPETFAAQLMPQNLDFYRAGPQITNVEQSDYLLHANAVWQENGQEYQRVLFFSQQENQPRLISTDPDYWGDEKQKQQSWGRLVYHERDEPWAGAITHFVTAEVAELCTVSCLKDNFPVTLIVRSGFHSTAEPGYIYVPSPRLLGLDESGRPSDRFWRVLEQHLADHLTPATIRFAVPPDHNQIYDLNNSRIVASEKLQRFDYAAAAEAFMAERPDIHVELVPMEFIPTSPEDLANIDGAAFVPTIEMIAGSQIHDLTPFMRSDPDFDRSDFYEQIWQGATWQDRLWMMPQAAQMPLLFYHRDAYKYLELEEPVIGWTWVEMHNDASKLTTAENDTGNTFTWGYLDQAFDSLYAYAFNNQSQCGSLEERPCLYPLTDADIVIALEWYGRLVREERIMPDPSQLLEEERGRLLINSLFKTAIWVDAPIYYEHRTLMFPMGILPFPGSDQFESSTPLWVKGSFISQQSEQPRAVWQWLKFLSEWPPMPRYRLIPARPSVGQKTNYWTTLPRELAEPMRAAFPFARPVRLEDRNIFNWPIIRAVMEGSLTPLGAAQEGRDYAWFGE